MNVRLSFAMTISNSCQWIPACPPQRPTHVQRGLTVHLNGQGQAGAPVSRTFSSSAPLLLRHNQGLSKCKYVIWRTSISSAVVCIRIKFTETQEPHESRRSHQSRWKLGMGTHSCNLSPLEAEACPGLHRETNQVTYTRKGCICSVVECLLGSPRSCILTLEPYLKVYNGPQSCQLLSLSQHITPVFMALLT